MTTNIPQLERLIKLLGMTGSAYDGERLNALDKALALMKQMNLTFEQALKPAAQRARDNERDWLRRETIAFDRGFKEGKQRGYDEGKQHGFAEGFNEGLKAGKVAAEEDQQKRFLGSLDAAAAQHRELFTQCMKHQTVMNGWERGFLASISEWLANNIPLTAKQSVTLSRIHTQYCR